ncbi:hypothetical protein EH223_16460 [candidate division KSB1 bacterium]|nr:hypothetical protein [candidate division KSB1 bacterium]RQW01117.1 MAG: hypothetical protein EH223_16460 [candidate division KSB1 bacterium]
MNKNYSSLTIGLIFILVGVGLLMDKMNLFAFGWKEIYPVIFILISVVSFINAFAGQKNSSFWGGVFGVLGAFFFLRNYDFVPNYWFEEFWPIFLIALGVGFIVLYIFNPRDWGVLIPGAILTGLGLVFIFESMDLIDNFFEIAFDAVFTYWPLVLILFGVALILGSLRHKETRDKETIQE